MTGRTPQLRKTILGRADLVAALAEDRPELLLSTAQQLGLERRPRQRAETEHSDDLPLVPAQSLKTVPDSTGYPAQAEPTALWLPVGFTSLVALVPVDVDEAEFDVEWTCRPSPANHRPLTPWSVLQSRVQRGLAELFGRRLDVPKLVDRVARRELIQNFPRQRERSGSGPLAIIRDLSERLAPFDQDQQHVIGELARMLPENQIVTFAGPHPLQLRRQWRSSAAAISAQQSDRFDRPAPGCQVLVLGDLGVLSSSPRAVDAWLRWGRQLQRRGCHLAALVPCSVKRVPARLKSVWSVQSWQQNPRADVQDPLERERLVRQILTLAAPAIRLEPGLLRDLRLLLPDAADASLEADVWMSPLLADNHPQAATPDPEIANGQLRPKFESLSDEALQRRALERIRVWHAGLEAPEVWFEELLSLSDRLRELVPEAAQDLADARAAIRAIVEESRSGEGEIAEDSQAWLSRVTLRVTQAARQDPEVGALLTEARQERHPQASQVETVSFSLSDTRAVFSPSRPGLPDRPVCGSIRSSDGRIEIGAPRADRFWKYGRPDFAVDFGTDEYGAWFDFEVPSDPGPVRHRLRWIPAGRFVMGSPESEAQRSENEVAHEVTLSRGFWLGSTTVPQSLWRAVTGANPSRFSGDDRPVEQVSFADVEGFLSSLNSQVSGLELCLPTEAQWEYACRAGTTTPFHTGETLTTDQANYNGNSPYGESPKGEYRQETVACGSLPPNGWGLHEMHGNLWEWCSDWHGKYSSEAQTDPVGPESGSHRVVRGGSWVSSARFVRSAYRNWYDPGLRHGSLGFRCCLSSASGAEPAAGVESPVAEQGPERTRAGGADDFFSLPTSDDTDDTAAQTVLLPRREVRILRSDLEEIRVERCERPAWAADFGQDRFGPFADFEVSANNGSVRQRLRWIRPGQFEMGSPEDEPGRSDREVPHTVTLSQGFWLFDTPCTQALWQAVTGENPSRFVDDLRPVEQVTWQQACDFASQLSEQMSGQVFQLPTEAQWEYACRAGTQTPLYSGPLEILGDTNAPALDPIAWYGGNSGHEFDHPNPMKLSKRDRQYDFESAGTRRVKEKAPNPWGLSDMLGNVWEWCSDWDGEYSSEPQTDPIGPESGSCRVVRGGSWFSHSPLRAVGLPLLVRPGRSGRQSGLPLLPEFRQSRPDQCGGAAVPPAERRECDVSAAEGRGRVGVTNAVRRAIFLRVSEMPYAFFQIPVQFPETASDELNRFLQSHRVVDVEKHCRRAVGSENASGPGESVASANTRRWPSF